MECPVVPYPWGSRETIARLQGRPVPSPGPEAELWVGAHPAASSEVAGRPLTARIAADSDAVLGSQVVERFGPRLPYLLKLLAAAAPLSLQAHPDPEQAAAGYAAEEAAGVPADAPHRRYVDPYHKPELLVAVSEFQALCGFRDPGACGEALGRLDVPGLDPVVAALAGGDLAAATRWLLQQPYPAPLVAAVAEAAAAAGDGDPAYAVASRLAADYPGDVGVLVAMLLNPVTLAPGQAIFMPAGNLHTYLSGTGVEVMAASDNVLRGGLTGKHVDVPELLRVMRFEVLADPVRDPVPVPVPADAGAGDHADDHAGDDAGTVAVVTWPVPVRDFALHRVHLGGPTSAVALAIPGPRTVLCVSGRLLVDDGAGEVTVRAGQAAFGAGGLAGPLRVRGAGEAYLVSPG